MLLVRVLTGVAARAMPDTAGLTAEVLEQDRLLAAAARSTVGLVGELLASKRILRSERALYLLEPRPCQIPSVPVPVALSKLGLHACQITAFRSQPAPSPAVPRALSGDSSTKQRWRGSVEASSFQVRGPQPSIFHVPDGDRPARLGVKELSGPTCAEAGMYEDVRLLRVQRLRRRGPQPSIFHVPDGDRPARLGVIGAERTDLAGRATATAEAAASRRAGRAAATGAASVRAAAAVTGGEGERGGIADEGGSDKSGSDKRGSSVRGAHCEGLDGGAGGERGLKGRQQRA
eukprot:CAMPEP_0185401286 /NCGR_PEP_ID=MMETSP1364-20130426/91219_1 /TAXON_ID=38817 /ORGANISM="Gephyrocapsa oceanica, Strain RCC1303" /LENGTH=289 /DNA_ID=CAMNT_0028003581 /DNA_START=401 /DNA_END=1272 /DNA_ORIENTATION=-